jgi:hypothetical protein
MQGTFMRFHVKLLFSLYLAFVLASILSPARVSARTAYANDVSAAPPTLQMVVGFSDNTRLDFWVPVSITISNSGPDFTGVLSVTTFTSPRPSSAFVTAMLPWSFRQSVALARGAQKQITINVPFYESPTIPRGILATLNNDRGKAVATAKDEPSVVDPGSVLIGILSDQSSQNGGFAPLNAATLPDPIRSLTILPLDASSLPDIAETLANFDVIILDKFTTRSLSAAQIVALQTWVNRGGALIEIGGQQGQQTLGVLPPQLLPVAIHGTATLPASANLLPVGSPGIAEIGQTPVKLSQPVTISSASLPATNDARRQAFSNISTVLASDNAPLIVQANAGQGIICFLAFDPTIAPLLSWPGTIALWRGLLLRSLRDQSLFPAIAPRFSSGPGALYLRGGLFQVLQPGTLLPVWALIFLLIGYIVLIGPVRLFILKRLKRPSWSWRIILSSAVVFSFLTYGLAFYQRSPSINSISLIQLNQGGQSAHVTTFFSVFAPGQGAVQVHIPGVVLAQPIVYEPFQIDERVANDSYHMTFTNAQNGTTIDLPDAGTWTLHPLISEGDQQVQGGLLSHLALQGGTLTGTVTNTLSTSLSDVYIVMPSSYVSIGHLQAGQTLQVNVPLHSASLTASTTLADQIARDNHLPVPYFPYDHNAQPKNAFQRHLAMLAALSGEGYLYTPCNGPCSTHAIVNTHIITAPPFGSPVNPLDSNDALLIAGAPATLIGWADQPFGATDNAAVNGIATGGSHDSLVQMPLNIDFPEPSQLPPGLISGQVVNATGNNLQIISPSVYSLTAGSITFAFTLPGLNMGQIHSMSIAEPFIGGTGSLAQVQLYNWTTGSWNTIALTSVSFNTGNTQVYISPDGHVLLHVGALHTSSTTNASNQHVSTGPIFFEKPSLSLNS